MRVLPTILLATVCAFAQAEPGTPLVAVMPLTPQGVDSASALVIGDALADEMMRAKDVRVMERSQMELILQEQGFQQSGACEASECAVQVGKILAIDQMIVGSIGKLGETYTLTVRTVDIATGEVLGSARRASDGSIDKVLTELLPVVVKDLSEQRLAHTSGQGSRRRLMWWTAGGVALAAGGVAAFVLLDDSGDDPAPMPNPIEVEGAWK